MSPKIKIIFITFELLFIGFLFWILPSLVIRFRSGPSNTFNNSTVRIVPGTIYRQQFKSDHPYLNSVSILLKNPSLQNRQNFTLEVGSSAVLRQITFNGFMVGDPSWIPFKFPPIPESANKSYEIRLLTDSPVDPTQIEIPLDSHTGTYSYKTTYTYPSIFDSLKSNLDFRLDQFNSYNTYFKYSYIILVLLLNILIFI